MKKRFILSVFVVIAVAFLMIASPVSAETYNGAEDSVESTDTYTSVSTSLTNGGEDATYVAPVNGEGYTNINNGSEDAAGVDADAVTNSVNNGGEDTVFVAPVKSSLTATEVNDNPRNSGGSSSSRRSSNRPNSIVALSIEGLSCPMITSKLLKVGGSNDSADITRLQTFLKNVEKLDVEVNGTFDTKTEAAVKAFQLKYKDTILAPWEATRASGIAYITTIKKLNEIACGNALTISSEELAVIDAYKNKATNSTSNDTPTTDNNAVIGATTDSTVAVDDSTEVEANNTATVSDAPVLKRFWNFVVGLFR